MKRYNSTRRQPFTSRRLQKKSTRNLIISIAILLIFSFLFVSWILPALVGGLTFLNKFKNSGKNNTSITSGETLAPPVLNIPYEATNTAEINIKGYAQPHETIEIYVDNELKKTVSTGEEGSFEAPGVELSLGVNNIYGKSVGEKDARSLASKTIRIVYDNKKPKLEISSPSDGQVVKGGDKRINVSGNTDPGIDIRINNVVAMVDSDGHFSSNIEINEGETVLTIIAQDIAGNSSSMERRVRWEP